MADLWAFLVACWTSGTLLRSVCALVIIPTAAWLTIRLLTPALSRTSNDPGWQAPLAAAAASIPGLLLVLLAVAALIAGVDASCRDTISGQVLFAAIVLLSTLAFVRALFLSVGRSREAQALVRRSTPAAGRLAHLAAGASVAAFVIEDDSLFCVLARVWRPVVVVSSGALQRLTDLELSAALHHERGHARRGDQLIAAALSFLVDLLPLPAMDLVCMYRRARELAADRHALDSVDAHDLASALLRFVQPAQSVAATAALGGDSTVRARLHLLLGQSSVPQVSVVKRTLLAFSLATVLGVGIAPAATALVHPVPCNMNAGLQNTSARS
ncbi:MAG: hypothetical protein NVS2B17_33440 [Candidatus Velthaea sp.]